mmetsp:Transcript_20984/g.54196  ORF Transcript_20984/g.54196 Transcript_20984/m.54196 type:complete len:483 (-) Transcript_20984:396-1844(-)
MCGEQAGPEFQGQANEEGLPTSSFCYKCGNTLDDLYLPFSKDIIENGTKKTCPCNHALCLECVEDVARTDLPENSNVVCGEVSSQACDCTIKPPRLRKFLGYDPQVKKELDYVFKSSCNNCHKPLHEDLLEEDEFLCGAHCPECQAPYCPLCYASVPPEDLTGVQGKKEEEKDNFAYQIKCIEGHMNRCHPEVELLGKINKSKCIAQAKYLRLKRMKQVYPIKTLNAALKKNPALEEKVREIGSELDIDLSADTLYPVDKTFDKKEFESDPYENSLQILKRSTFKGQEKVNENEKRVKFIVTFDALGRVTYQTVCFIAKVAKGAAFGAVGGAAVAVVGKLISAGVGAVSLPYVASTAVIGAVAGGAVAAFFQLCRTLKRKLNQPAPTGTPPAPPAYGQPAPTPMHKPGLARGPKMERQRAQTGQKEQREQKEHAQEGKSAPNYTSSPSSTYDNVTSESSKQRFWSYIFECLCSLFRRLNVFS